MARFEVIESVNGRERIVATTRRENGAINEWQRAIDSATDNARRRRIGGWVVSGPTGRTPHEWVVVSADSNGDERWVWYTIRGGGVTPDPDIDPEPWVASIIAANGASL